MASLPSGTTLVVDAEPKHRSPRLHDERQATAAKTFEIRLLRSFALECSGRPVDLPLSVQRLVTFLSLHDHPLHRQHVAGMLWPETTDQRASANLRSALWRLNQLECPVVMATGSTLVVSPNATVDLRRSTALAHVVLRDAGAELLELAACGFCSDILPDWYDDWLVVEREQFRQLRLRALECLSARLIANGRYGLAAEAAMEAIACEPLRESAHRALAAVHLAEGNRAEAVRQYNFYRQLLGQQLGFEPSPHFRELVGLH